MRDRVWEVLTKPMMTIQIQAVLCPDDHDEHADTISECPIKIETIKKALQRMEKRSYVVRVTGAGQRTHWSRTAKVGEEPMDRGSNPVTGTAGTPFDGTATAKAGAEEAQNVG